MRGINRTRDLKLNHPGLDTAAMRDGARLLLQNDIGTNDAHVLVIQVEDTRVALTYSDLHRRRFRFFQSMLAELGAQWSAPVLRSTEGLNAGDAFEVGTATFDCGDEDALRETLESLGARIVFLIDWNRARKRLELLVTKADALAVLAEGARREVGHMGWLACGGERLVFGAMQALGPDYFQIGDRPDQVLGSDQAREFLVQVLSVPFASASPPRWSPMTPACCWCGACIRATSSICSMSTRPTVTRSPKRCGTGSPTGSSAIATPRRSSRRVRRNGNIRRTSS